MNNPKDIFISLKNLLGLSPTKKFLSKLIKDLADELG